MGVVTGINTKGGGVPQRNEGYLAVGERMLKVQLGKEILNSSLIEKIKSYGVPKNEAFFVGLAERHLSQDKAWQKKYEVREAAYIKLFDSDLDLPVEKKKVILAQAAKFPIMQEALHEIGENPDAKSSMKLAILSDFLSDAVKDEDDETALAQLTQRDVEGKEIKAAIAAIKEESKRDLKALREKRKNAPVSKKAIELQAELHRAIREGKEWSKGQITLNKVVGSANKVYKLFKEHEPAIAAFFKVGAGNEEGSGKMEKLIWDMAVILGVEARFAPTGETELRTKKELLGGQEEAMQWDEGDLMKLSAAREALRGGIQPAQEGKTLKGLQGNAVSTCEVAEGVLVSLIFGMFDLHSNNIMITKQYEIRFFDNTRSMPNCNGFLNDGAGIIPSYRCALLDLPQSQRVLNNNEIEILQNEVASVKGKMGKLREFLNIPQTKAMLEKLPPGWMDMTASLDAMELRVAALEAALQNGKVKTAADLVEQCNPDYKFAFALTTLTRRIFDPANFDPDNLHNYVGYEAINDYCLNLISNGYDLSEIKQWCDDLSLNDLVQKVVSCDLAALRDPSPSHEKVERNQEIMDGIVKTAVMDLKDVQKKSCINIVLQFNLEALGNERNIKMVNEPFAGAYLKFEQMKEGAVIFYDQDEYKIIYKTPGDYAVEKIDLSAIPGKIKIGGKAAVIKDLINNL